MKLVLKRLLTPQNALLLLVIGLFVAWLLLLRPTLLGGPASYVWVSGRSMEPTLDSGTLVVAQSRDAYRVGEIVVFRVPEGQRGHGAIVIHRIVGGSARDGFEVKGDNNNGADPWRLRRDDILGKLWFSVPCGGRALAVLKQPLLLGGLGASVSVFLILSGGGPETERTRKRPSSSPHRAGRLFPPWSGLGLGLFQVAGLVVAFIAGFDPRKWV